MMRVVNTYEHIDKCGILYYYSNVHEGGDELMDLNNLFISMLFCADEYQKRREHKDRCTILKQGIRDASLAQIQERDKARQILMTYYGLHEASNSELQKCLNKLDDKLERSSKKYEKSFNRLLRAINDTFGNWPVEDVWPQGFISRANEPESDKYYVYLVDFSNEEQFARRAFYREKLKGSQKPMTPCELEDAYIECRMIFDAALRKEQEP